MTFLKDEYNELLGAKGDLDLIAESVDIANFCMMLADVCKALHQQTDEAGEKRGSMGDICAYCGKVYAFHQDKSSACPVYDLSGMRTGFHQYKTFKPYADEAGER